MYSTLDSLDDGSMDVRDPDRVTMRNYTTADGTELMILSNSQNAVLYVYLEDSFFVESISLLDSARATAASGESGLVDEDVNYIVDLINYTLIG